MFSLRKYISFLSLLAFLFPQALNLVHELEHRNDLHCPEKTIVHFHNEEHHCDICDLLPLISGDIRFENFVSSFHYFSRFNYTIAPVERITSLSRSYALLRGPPIV
ncbi:MAG: hypothetical protein ACJ76F_03475 [Bacteroidia bacterium]